MTSVPMGIMRKRSEKSGIGVTAGTMAGAGPTDLLYYSRGLPAAYRRPGSLGPEDPSPNGHRVTIDHTIQESLVVAQGGKIHSDRRMGTDMEDIVTLL